MCMIKESQFNILYAEDDPAHAELFRRALTSSSIQASLDHVTDGLQVLDYLYRRGKYEHLTKPQPNLIFLDLHMPKYDGVQVLRMIRLDQLLKHIPVVILSATYAAVIERKYDLDANSSLVKPTDIKSLTTMIEALCRRYWHWSQQRTPATLAQSASHVLQKR